MPQQNQSYLSPEERRRIIARRNKIMRELTHIMIVSSDKEADLAALVKRYGADEVNRVRDNANIKSGPFIGNALYIYREYRRLFACYGGDRRFLSRDEYEVLSYEFALEYMKSIEQAPSPRERELRDLLLSDARIWPDIFPLDAPPRPADFEAPPAGDYDDPVQKLLTWGPNEEQGADREEVDLDMRERRQWRPYIPDLTRMALDDGLIEGWPSEPASWAPLHALRMLGALRAAEAGPQLFALLGRENDWLSDLLPGIWGRMGRAMTDALWAYIDDRSHDAESRGIAMAGLREQAAQRRSRRRDVIRGLTSRLRDAPADDQVANAYIVHVLDALDANEAADVIAAAFEADKIDHSIIGPRALKMLA